MRVSALWICLLLAGSLAAPAQPVLPQVADPLGTIQTAEVLTGGADPFEAALAGMATSPAGIRSGVMPASRARRPAEATAVASIVSGNRYFFYTPEMSLLAESALGTSGTPAIQYEYVWFGGEPVAQIDGGTTVHWTFADHLGTPWVQTDAAGAQYWRAEYEPYGRVFSLSTADQHQPLRLPGQEAEQLNLGVNGVSERSYNVFRWYRPGWGRYTQRDPQLNPFAIRQGIYSYSAENPIRFLDRLGLTCGPCCDSPAQFNDDLDGLIRSANRDLFVYLSRHFYVPQTRCDTYAAVVEQGIATAKPRCHDWTYVFSEERSKFFGVVPIPGLDAPAHTATVLKPCSASSWSDGLILDAWPGGKLTRFRWTSWRPGVRTYTPVVYPGIEHPASCTLP